MKTIRRFKTNLNCKSCVAAVKPHLDKEKSVRRWDVDTSTPDKLLSAHGDNVSAEAIRAAVGRAGFQVLEEVETDQAGSELLPNGEAAPAASYYPLALLGAFLVGTVALVEVRVGSFVAERAMTNFMGAFFLALSFFKLLDLRGFAESYQMYDVVARRVPAYGYIYPFIELLLGAAYVSGVQPYATNVFTLIVMSVSSVGVVQSLVNKRKVRCACLGTVFSLPMFTVTLLEDAAMIAMAVATLASAAH